MIRKMILKILRWATAADMHSSGNLAYESPTPVRKSGLDGGDNGITFKLYTAIGGHVIETITYDPQTDRRTANLYIITSENDFGEEIAHIITREKLSR